MRRHPGVKSHRVAILDGITSPGAAASQRALPLTQTENGTKRRSRPFV